MANLYSIPIGKNESAFSPLWEIDDSALFYGLDFSPMALPKLQLKNPPQHEYVIYENKTEYKIVQANTALEAMEQCGITKPHKIIHMGSRLANIIDHCKLVRAAENENAESDSDAEEIQQPQAAAAEDTTAEVAATPAANEPPAESVAQEKASVPTPAATPEATQ